MRFLLAVLGGLKTRVQFWVDRRRLKNLVARGMKIGKNVYIMEGFDFDLAYPHLIEIEDGCRISKGVRILTHDATPFRELGITSLGKVKIGSGTFIGERAFILSGVTIGSRSMIAAGAFVSKDFPDGAMVAGNPARLYGYFDDYLDRVRRQCADARFVPKELLENASISPGRLALLLDENERVFVFGVPNSDPFYVNTDMDSVRALASKMFEQTLEHSNDPAGSVEEAP